MAGSGNVQMVEINACIDTPCHQVRGNNSFNAYIAGPRSAIGRAPDS